ncbi:xanthine dehydrogenase accessory protein XdhC [Nioella nitratireducens]|uniref:xanthine dehydrogenase accessory protein XdhC n=1 Tax=Nioella nitratireducens TaxID=1287720 RepID=UPI0008FD54FF|nr:xanthine dehydrogenase accessory protein XdhC [Nioella nitratireducens]
MSLDRDSLADAILAHGRVARVVVVATAGSVPRSAGTAMLVWKTGQSGTIGGGALEFQAVARARAALAGGDRFDKVPLGPGLGQCCGGAVQLLTEVWDADRLSQVTGEAIARPLPGTPGEMPLKLAAAMKAARAGHQPVTPRLVQGWVVEPVRSATTPLWVWGGGHVGRAIVATLAPLPDLRITWIDSAPDRFPNDIPERVVALPAPDMAAAMRLAPADARHLILTYSHEIDLALCHAALAHGFKDCGLIGSATKWARFRTRLRQLGHGDAQISRIACPIGDTSLGKHPQAIAVGVAAGLLKDAAGKASHQEPDCTRVRHSGG